MFSETTGRTIGTPARGFAGEPKQPAAFAAPMALIGFAYAQTGDDEMATGKHDSKI